METRDQRLVLGIETIDDIIAMSVQKSAQQKTFIYYPNIVTNR